MELRERERGSQTSAHYNRTQEDGKYSRVKLRQREDSQNGFTRVRAVANRLYRGTPLSPFESRLHLLRSTTEWRWGNWRGGSVGERVQSIGSKSGAKDRLRTWRVKGKLGEFSRFFFVFPSLSIIFLSLVFFFLFFASVLSSPVCSCLPSSLVLPSSGLVRDSWIPEFDPYPCFLDSSGAEEKPIRHRSHINITETNKKQLKNQSRRLQK